jgi:hypothetical protein
MKPTHIQQKITTTKCNSVETANMAEKERKQSATNKMMPKSHFSTEQDKRKKKD